MAVKNGRYKDKQGAIRHFETNENMVVVDNGQKTLKQKLTSLVDNIANLGNKFTSHETSETAHTDIRETLATHTHEYNTITGLPNLDSKLDILKPVVSESLNQLLPFGIYRFMNATEGFPNGYTADNDFILYNNKVSASENWSPQILIDVRDTGKIYKRVVQASTFYEWEEVVTTNRINNLSLLNGWVVLGTNEHTQATAVKNGSVVHITGIIKNGAIADGTAIIQLSDGWKPSYAQTIQVLTYKGTANPLSRVNITSDGAIRVYGLSDLSQEEWVNLNITYIL